MKHPTHIYAKALAETVVTAHGKGHEEIRRNFMDLVRSSGDEAHLSSIVRETERLLREKDGTKKFSVHVARTSRRPVRELMGVLAGPRDVVEEVVDPSLIAGMKVVMNDQMVFDGSLKSKLDKLFSI